MARQQCRRMAWSGVKLSQRQNSGGRGCGSGSLRTLEKRKREKCDVKKKDFLSMWAHQPTLRRPIGLSPL